MVVLEKKPMVSICTVTYNRRKFLPLLEQCIAEQKYPLDRVEWIILDDSDNGEPPFIPKESLGITCKYIVGDRRLALGEKRNKIHHYCSGDIFVYMDDDDFYPAERVSHAVTLLTGSKCLVAASTILPIYFLDLRELWISGPFANNHGTAGTFAFYRELLETQAFEEGAERAEESFFLNQFTIPMVQLDPLRTIISMSHGSNTFDKKQLIAKGKSPNMRKVNAFPSDSTLGNRLRKYEEVLYLSKP